MELTKTTNSPSEFVHASREENLLAAKKAVRENRRARIMRHAFTTIDILDIIVGSTVIERHVCKTVGPRLRASGKFNVDSLALYR